MITVKVTKDHEQCIKAVEIKGHANYAKHGEDIVCAAISFLSQAILNGLLVVIKADVDYKINEEGFLSFNIHNNEHKQETIKALLDTFELGITSLLEDYSKHVKLVKEEV